MRRAETAIPRASASLFAHLDNYLISFAFFDQFIVAACLLETDVSEEQRQNHHPGDRDVIGLGDDIQKLPQSADMFHSNPPCPGSDGVSVATTGRKSAQRRIDQALFLVYQPYEPVST
jgi:hypothetical protein